MTRSLIVALLVLPTAVAFADDAPPAAAAETAPATVPAGEPPPEAPPLDPFAACKELRRALEQSAATLANIHERTALLQAMPDCANLERKPAFPKLSPDASDPEHPRPGIVIDVETGLGLTIDSPGVASQVGTFNLGLGGFVNHDVVIMARFAGAILYGSNGAGYVGLVGPSLQWFSSGNAFIGAGLGLSFAAACTSSGASTCDGTTAGLGLDARAGVALFHSDAGAATLSAEWTALAVSGTQVNIVSVLFGFESF